MRCVDVNVLLYAYREEFPEHDQYRRRLESWSNAEEPLGLPDVVLSGFVRIATNRRVFAEPETPAEVWSRVDELLTGPAATRLSPGASYWRHFRRLAKQIDAKGNDVTDAYIAAYAAENNATLISADHGFKRFDGLRWQHPLA